MNTVVPDDRQNGSGEFEIIPESELLSQPFVRQGLASYAEYLKERIIQNRNNQRREIKSGSRHSNKRVLQS